MVSVFLSKQSPSQNTTSLPSPENFELTNLKNKVAMVANKDTLTKTIKPIPKQTVGKGLEIHKNTKPRVQSSPHIGFPTHIYSRISPHIH